MIISFKHKFVFIAIPKTASQAVRLSLRSIMDVYDWEQCGLYDVRRFPNADLAALETGHIRYDELTAVLSPHIFSGFKLFAFTREPLARFISAFLFRRRESPLPGSQIADAMKRELEDIGKSSGAGRWLHYRPQSNFLPAQKSSDLDAKWGRYERLENEYLEICHWVGISPPQLETVNHRTHPIQFEIDGEIQSMCFEIYREDYARFGYPEPNTNR